MTSGMFIEAPELSSHSAVRHAFFTRRGGVSEGVYASLNGGLGSSDDLDRVRENRRRMTNQLGLSPDALVSVHQVHSPDAVLVEHPFPPDARPRADGMVTARPGLALGITTADCGPVLFADPEAAVIGACHAGWRGALTGILEATIEAMEGIGAERGRIIAVLGPTIGFGAYEVGPEFVAKFQEHSDANGRFFRSSARQGHSLFDLPGYIGARLTASGIGEYVDLKLCTYSDEERFFSYRRTTHRGETDYGRLISAIALTP
jgi:YfiH family protein